MLSERLGVEFQKGFSVIPDVGGADQQKVLLRR